MGVSSTAVQSIVPADYHTGTANIDSEKANLQNAEDHDPDSVHQLDNTMVRPTVELGQEPLGSIPELPATDMSPTQESHHQPRKKNEKNDPDNHVMSWAHLNSAGTRNSRSRLSRPLFGPDTAGTVWGNMAPAKGPEKVDVVEEEPDEKPDDNRPKS